LKAAAGEVSGTADPVFDSSSGSCFVATAAWASSSKSRAELVAMFGDILASEFDKVLAGAIALGLAFALCARRKRRPM